MDVDEAIEDNGDEQPPPQRYDAFPHELSNKVWAGLGWDGSCLLLFT